MQFIWQSRFIGPGPYNTVEGSTLEILFPGTLNENQGPDFFNARIKIADTEWAGNIELHLLASDWIRHKHEQDPNFNNIILHVVWENDQVLFDQFGLAIPTFCLQPYVSNLLLNRYEYLMQGNPFIKPCHHFLPAMNQLNWLAWKERLVVERLEKRAQRIVQLFKESRQDWETVCWWCLAANFGLKVNGQLFELVARSISLRILANHRNQIHQLEALLMGQSNLLNQTFEEHYPKMLQREYHYLQKKYQLEKIQMMPAFLRMRPASFPTVRLAQLASFILDNAHFFDLIKNANAISLMHKKLIIVPNDYWLYHYRFDEPTAFHKKRMGQTMIDSILINTVVPILYTYGSMMKESSYQEKALNWLLEIRAEQNKYTNEWMELQVQNKTGFDSQALIELTQNYCQKKNCLDCIVGVKILGKA